MKPRKPFSLAVAAATLLATSFSPSASAELTDREASIVPIAAFTANGNQEQLKKALAKGLDKGPDRQRNQSRARTDVRLYRISAQSHGSRRLREASERTKSRRPKRYGRP